MTEGVLAGFGEVLISMLILLFGLFVMLKIKPLIDVWVRKSIKKSVLEECCIDSFAAKKGIDLEKEIAKQQVYKSKDFQMRIMEEVTEDFFEDKKKK